MRLHGRPLAGAVDLADLARRAEAMTGAEIELICQRAALRAMRDFLAAHGEAGDPRRLAITAVQLLAAIEELTEPGNQVMLAGGNHPKGGP